MDNPAECPICHHAPILHESDGTGATCIACVWLAGQETDPVKRNMFPVCIRIFQFKLSRSEREQAARASKDSWEQRALCINCGYEWRQHTGFLCPSGDSTFLPYIEGHRA